MFSDYEVECMYLGKPFEEKTLRSEETSSVIIPINREDRGLSSPDRRLFSFLAGAARAASK